MQQKCVEACCCELVLDCSCWLLVKSAMSTCWMTTWLVISRSCAAAYRQCRYAALHRARMTTFLIDEANAFAVHHQLPFSRLICNYYFFSGLLMLLLLLLLLLMTFGSCLTSLLFWVTLPSPPVDIISATVIVWRIKGKIVRTVLCSVVYDNYAQWYRRIWAVLEAECWFRFRFSPEEKLWGIMGTGQKRVRLPSQKCQRTWGNSEHWSQPGTWAWQLLWWLTMP